MMKNPLEVLLFGSTSIADQVDRVFARIQPRPQICRIDTPEALEDALDRQAWTLIVAEMKIACRGPQHILDILESRQPPPPVVLLAETGTEPEAIACLERGVQHCLSTASNQLPRLPLLARLIAEQAENSLSMQKLADKMARAEERYLDIFENTNDLVQCLAPDGSFLYTNRAWRKTIGYSEEEIESLNLIDILHADSKQCCQERFDRLNSGEMLCQIDFKFVTKAGETIHLSGDCGTLFKDGEAVSIRGIFNNITETVKAESALRASETRYQTLYENAPDIYMTLNAEGIILSINRTGAHILGYEASELTGLSVTCLIREEDIPRVLEHVDSRFQSFDEDQGIEYRQLCKDGTAIWVHQRASLDSNTDDPRLLVIARDISDQKQLELRLSYQASHDPLTDLLNRREFETRLNRLLTSTTIAHGEHVLCYLDLDQFKVINDTCGHMAGDELLRQVASVLTGQVRSRDALARLGGDEFGILMEHCPTDRAGIVAENIRAAIETHHFQWHERRFSLGISIGLIPLTGGGELKNILNLADSACYTAKQNGRNRVHLYHTDDQQVSSRVGDIHWATSLTSALDHNQFRLYAQPIRACEAGKSANQGFRYEILLRLIDDGNLVRPGNFMPAAERYNLAPRLDRWVVDSVLTWFEDNTPEIEKVEAISINLSALSLCDEAFLAFLLKRLDKAILPNSKLWFEITETAAIANLTRATTFMQSLRNVGCHFALDDFGSGLSSFAYLRDLPIDMIKIDGAFVRNIDSNDVDRMMVKSICEIGKMMGKKTTAEYVESAAVLDLLESIGIDYVQGYHLGKPAPLSEQFAADHNNNVIYLNH